MTSFDELDFDEIEVAGTPDFIRDRWGRPIINGNPYTRISTLAGGIESKYGLHVWEKHHVAMAIARCPDLRLRLQGLTYNDKSELGDICKEALIRAKDHGTDPTGSLRKANIGTAIHTFIERDTAPKTSDDEPEIEAVVSILELRKRTLEEYGLTVHSVGPKLVNHRLRCAGTGDEVLATKDGRFFIADAKSGRENIKSATVQLSGYASCDLYDLSTGMTTPFQVDQHVAFIEQIDVAGGTFELIKVYIGPDTDTELTPIELASAVHRYNSVDGVRRRTLARMSLDR